MLHNTIYLMTNRIKHGIITVFSLQLSLFLYDILDNTYPHHPEAGITITDKSPFPFFSFVQQAIHKFWSNELQRISWEEKEHSTPKNSTKLGPGTLVNVALHHSQQIRRHDTRRPKTKFIVPRIIRAYLLYLKPQALDQLESYHGQMNWENQIFTCVK